MNKLVMAVLLLGLSLSNSFADHDPYYYYGEEYGAPYGYGHFHFDRWPEIYLYNGFSMLPYYGYERRYATFGVIAYSSLEDKVGYAFGYDTRTDAAWNAVASCNAADCRPVVWTQGGCASLYTSYEEFRVGWGYGTSRRMAQSAARRSCKAGGIRGCKQRAWVCSF